LVTLIFLIRATELNHGSTTAKKGYNRFLAIPYWGWNARDSLAEMNPLDAVQMVNFFPTPTDVTLRKGYSKVLSIGITGASSVVDEL